MKIPVLDRASLRWFRHSKGECRQAAVVSLLAARSVVEPSIHRVSRLAFFYLQAKAAFPPSLRLRICLSFVFCGQIRKTVLQERHRIFIFSGREGDEGGHLFLIQAK